MADKQKLPLGTLLIQKGVISEDQLRIALIEQKRSGDPLGETGQGRDAQDLCGRTARPRIHA